MKRLIVATRNNGKVKEIRELLKLYDYEVLSQQQAGVYTDIMENGRSFEENSLIKARAIQKITGGMVIADDSGLEIDFLNGAPGIFSARFLGNVGDDRRYEGVLALLDGIPEEYRTARFKCAASLVTDNKTFTFCGTIEGRISQKPMGEYGFGYDPIFYLPDYQKTMAQLSPEIKNRISHRGKAFSKLADKLRNWSNP